MRAVRAVRAAGVGRKTLLFMAGVLRWGWGGVGVKHCFSWQGRCGGGGEGGVGGVGGEGGEGGEGGGGWAWSP